MTPRDLTSEADLVAAAVALGAAEYGGPLSEAESELVEVANDLLVDGMFVASQIQSGEDPLGDALCRIRSRAERRRIGQFLTEAARTRAPGRRRRRSSSRWSTGSLSTRLSV